MAEERTYTISLRKEFSKTKPYKRASKAVRAVRAFLQRHMKTDDVRLGKHLNLRLWQHGMKNPPARVSVTVTKNDKGVAHAEIVGAPKEAVVEKKEETKKAETPVQKIKEALNKNAPDAVKETKAKKGKATSEEKPAGKTETPVSKKSETAPAVVEKKESAAAKK